jgi:hypothetical protein
MDAAMYGVQGIRGPVWARKGGATARLDRSAPPASQGKAAKRRGAFDVHRVGR